MRSRNRRIQWGIFVLLPTIIFMQGCSPGSKSEPQSSVPPANSSVNGQESENASREAELVVSTAQSSVSLSSKAEESENPKSVAYHTSFVSSKASLVSSTVTRPENKDPMEILFIGDSNTEVGFISNPVKNKLEAAYGYTGSGYTSLNEDFFTPKRRGVRVVNDIHWTKCDMVTYQRRLDSPYDAAHGMWITSAVKDAVTLVDFRGTAVDVYYLAKPGGGSFIIEIDNQQKVTVNTAADSRISKKVTVSALSDADLHSMRLIVKEGSVSLQGFDAKKGTERGIVHSWGNSSAATTDFLTVEEAVFCSDLSALNPNYVVIMLGTNDHVVDQLSGTQFKRNLITLIKRVQKALPKAKILLVSTFQTNTPEVKTLLKEYLKTSYPEASKETGCTYFDMSSWFGTYRKSLMMDNYHCNEDGGKKVADELWNRLQSL